jgi:L-alanine-DL-glutamate epimerase-like enolase superfamily enzyme
MAWALPPSTDGAFKLRCHHTELGVETAHELCEFPFASKPLARAFTANHLDRDAEGYVSVPDTPGLGIAIDAQGARQYFGCQKTGASLAISRLGRH